MDLLEVKEPEPSGEAPVDELLRVHGSRRCCLARAGSLTSGSGSKHGGVEGSASELNEEWQRQISQTSGTYASQMDSWLCFRWGSGTARVSQLVRVTASGDEAVRLILRTARSSSGRCPRLLEQVLQCELKAMPVSVWTRRNRNCGPRLCATSSSAVESAKKYPRKSSLRLLRFVDLIRTAQLFEVRRDRLETVEVHLYVWWDSNRIEGTAYTILSTPANAMASLRR